MKKDSTSSGAGPGSDFLTRIDMLKRRYGGGIEEFEPAPMRFQAWNPFSRHANKETRRKPSRRCGSGNDEL